MLPYECTLVVMILDDRLPFIQRHDFLLMLDGQLFHFPARKSQNAKEMVFKVDTPVCIITKQNSNYFGSVVHLMTRKAG